MSVTLSQYVWKTRPSGLTDRNVKLQKRINDPEMRRAMLACAQRYVLGEVEAFKFVESGHNIAKTLKARRVIRETRADGTKFSRYEEIPATMEHVGAISYHTADDSSGNPLDDDGNDLEPFVIVTFHECSQAYVRFAGVTKAHEAHPDKSPDPAPDPAFASPLNTAE